MLDLGSPMNKVGVFFSLSNFVLNCTLGFVTDLLVGQTFEADVFRPYS